jgi:betaine-aldehyde dehydrogenase
MTRFPALQTWIGGIAEDSEIAETRYLHDPNTGEALQRLQSSSLDQIDRAIRSAADLHERGSWRNLDITERAEFLRAFADRLELEIETIAYLDAVNSGVPIAVTRPTAASLAASIERAVVLALDRGDSQKLVADQGCVVLKYVPWGPTAIILPWNAPSAVAVKKMAYALIAGAPVIVKPSSSSPWSVQVIAAAAKKSKLPDGTFSVVMGGAVAGQKLASDPRIRALSLTGSTETGRSVAIAAAPNFTRLQLELGSNNPVIVRHDADINQTASLLHSGMTKLNGQWCEAPRMVYADRAVYPDLLVALEKRLDGQAIGSSLEEETTLGPLAFHDRLVETESLRSALLNTEGVYQLRSPATPAEGWFFPPTVVYGERVALEKEIFAPMIAVRPTDSDEEAIALANAGQVGLAAYVFSTDLIRAAEVGSLLIAGEVKINGTSLLDMASDSAQSFFGGAGIGGHGDADLLAFFSGKQIVGVDLIDAPI